MNSTMQKDTRRVPVKAALIAVACTMVAAAGCGGGGSGEGRIGFGSGQDPDPVVLDFPIAYVKRPVPLDDNGDPTDFDVREPVTFDIGADLYVRDRASPSTADVNVTGEITEGLGDVRDLEVSRDGTRVLFAMRAQFIEGADEEDQPTWNVWEYDIPGDTLRRIITSDIVAESGHDLAPAYLPDERIIFSSTRQRQSGAVLLDEGKPQFSALDEDRNVPALVLHVMNADGTDIRQVSFNQSHDLDPAVLSNGQVVFSRWDNAPGNDGIHLYRMNPDGAALELLYGANSHDTGSGGEPVQFLRPRELPNGNVMALLRPFDGAGGGGDIIEIDVANYIENTQPNRDNIGVLSGPAQSAATINEVLIDDDAPSPGGRYNSVFPLRDGTERLLVSWSQCRLQDPARRRRATASGSTTAATRPSSLWSRRKRDSCTRTSSPRSPAPARHRWSSTTPSLSPWTRTSPPRARRSSTSAASTISPARTCPASAWTCSPIRLRRPPPNVRLVSCGW